MLEREVAWVAPRLLGAQLSSCVDDLSVSVRITEVEAYAGHDDPGSHAYRGPTARNRAMFGPFGHLYVYFTYGMHWCANIVTGGPGSPAAVLLRAGEIIEGHDVARMRRPAARADAGLARGPARLAACLGLTGRHDGMQLLGADARWPADGQVRLLVRGRSLPRRTLRCGLRVGVAGPGGAEPFRWRYWIEGDPSVSAYRAAPHRR